MNKGIIKISNILYKEEYDGISGIFKYFKPTHIEFKHWENDIWYFYGESLLFENVKEGEVIPFYMVEIINNNGVFDYKFKRE